MKILSIVRLGVDIPNFPTIFTVGNNPAVGTELIGPAVKSINFYETGCNSGRVYRGPCYVISFEESNQKRVVPATNVIDIMYDTEAETKKKAAKKPAKAISVTPDANEGEGMEA